MRENDYKIWWAIAVIIFSLSSCTAIVNCQRHKTMRTGMEQGYDIDLGGFSIKY